MKRADHLDLETVVTAWLRDLRARQCSPATLQKYQIGANRFSAFLRARRRSAKLGALSVETAREYIAWLRDEYTATNPIAKGPPKPLSESSVSDYASILKAFAAWLAEDGGYLADNPLAKLRTPRRPLSEPQVLSIEQVQALLYQAERGGNAMRDTALLLVLLDTGLRVAELCNLNRTDLDTDSSDAAAVLHVRRGKGGKSRTVFLSRQSVRALLAYLRQRDGRRRGPARQTEALFQGMQGGRLSTEAVRRQLARYAQRAGINGRVHPHLFRHTNATRLLANGANAFTVQRLLGHSRIQTTQRYIHLTGTDLAESHAMASPVQAWDLGKGQRRGKRSA